MCDFESCERPRILGESPLAKAVFGGASPDLFGPIVTSDKVFVTETVNKEKEGCSCLDRATVSRALVKGLAGRYDRFHFCGIEWKLDSIDTRVGWSDVVCGAAC